MKHLRVLLGYVFMLWGSGIQSCPTSLENLPEKYPPFFTDEFDTVCEHCAEPHTETPQVLTLNKQSNTHYTLSSSLTLIPQTNQEESR